jgi:hypothetical protein
MVCRGQEDSLSRVVNIFTPETIQNEFVFLACDGPSVAPMFKRILFLLSLEWAKC